MLSLFAQSELTDLLEKVEKGERLDFAAGVRMMNSQDILALGYMANLVRERKNGNKTYFLVKEDHTDFLNVSAHATMTYGPGYLETAEERINYLLKLRELQDETGDFLTFCSFPCDPASTRIEGLMGFEKTTGFEDLKMMAIARTFLDNFDHLTAFCGLLGPKLAQVSLIFGVNDLVSNGTMSKRALIQLIHKAGRDAQERDTRFVFETD